MPQAPQNSSAEKIEQLIQELQSGLEGEVRFDDGSRAIYATDASNYRQIPLGVVIPKTIQDVVLAINLCRRFDMPILTRGGGTSVAGQCCNEAVVIDFSKYLNKVLEIDFKSKTCRVEPGLVLDDLKKEVARHGLSFGPDPSTHSRCTLGGMIGNDACGVHSLAFGRTLHNVLSLKVLTYDGHILNIGKGAQAISPEREEDAQCAKNIEAQLKGLRDTHLDLIASQYPNIPRRVSGYGLDQLLDQNDFYVARSLVGTEGTCVVILEATLSLSEMPEEVCLLALGYPNIVEGAKDLEVILKSKPLGCEAVDAKLIENMELKKLAQKNRELLPKKNSWIFLEFGGKTLEEAKNQAKKLMQQLEKKATAPFMELFEDPEEQRMVWGIREIGPGATVFVPGKKNTWSGWEDSAVHPEKLADYLEALQKLLDEYGYESAMYGHFGEGCVHTRISFDFSTAEGMKKFRSFMKRAAELVVSFGGSLSGEHGDGHSRGELLEVMYDPKLIDGFKTFKQIWDPAGMMNPGKIIDAYKMDEYIRPLEARKNQNQKMFFDYQNEGASFSEAVSRCVGIGKCRSKDVGTMCPSYRATLEEKHSTRGRARLLSEMFQEDLLEKGWQSEEVKEALDLCLACKACKTECPTNVDMAKYKSEFMAQYYASKKRPFHACFFGNIAWWLGIAAKAPLFSNSLLESIKIKSFLNRFLEIQPNRKFPSLAKQKFRKWFKRRRRTNQLPRPEVILWIDTWNEYFYPDLLIAATRVLEKLGFHVKTLKKHHCCGRPFYDFGMLKEAKRSLKKILKQFGRNIRRGVPVVVLEPSCLSVFRDEMVSLFPNDLMAKKFSKQLFTVSEFVNRYSGHLMIPKLKKSVVYHQHCHGEALWGNEEDQKLLNRLGIDYKIMDSGCCGMAGSFGFMEANYEVSMKIGERKFFPNLEGMASSEEVMSEGFSCHEQAYHGTQKKTKHLVEYLAEALGV